MIVATAPCTLHVHSTAPCTLHPCTCTTLDHNATLCFPLCR